MNVRCCRVCPTREKTECNWREFNDPQAICPVHGRGETEPNRPYCGVQTPQHPSLRELA